MEKLYECGSKHRKVEPGELLMALESEFPREFGRYTLVQNLGAGGMGMVYLAWGGTQEAPTQCVLKTIRPGFNGPGAETRFMDEARISAMLRHNNICTVFDVGEVSAECFMAMDYMGRITLRNLFDRAAETQNGVSLEMAVWIACEVLNGLYYAHSYKNEQGKLLNIVHRDVSPQNIMITANGEVKLIDFGLAYSDDKVEKTEVGATQGKIQYMAPEQVKAEAIGPQADLFAVAMLIYEMVVGERFYAGLAGKHEIWKVAGGGFLPQRWGLFEQMAPELASYTKKALSEKPGDRWQDALAFRKALQKFVNSSTRDMPDSLEMKQLLHRLWPTLEEDERKYLQTLPKPHGLPSTLPSVVGAQSAEKAGQNGFGQNRKIEESGHTLTQFEKQFKPDTSNAAVEQTMLVKPNAQKEEKPKAVLFAVAAGVLLLAIGGVWVLGQNPQNAEKLETQNAVNEELGQKPKVEKSVAAQSATVEKSQGEKPAAAAKIKLATNEKNVAAQKKLQAKSKTKMTLAEKVKRIQSAQKVRLREDPSEEQGQSSAAHKPEKGQKKVHFRPGQSEKRAAQVVITEKAPKTKIEQMRADLQQCQNPCASMWLKKLQGRSQIDGGKAILIGRCIRKCN